MDEISELEGRLSAALDRIRRGVEAARAGGAEAADLQERAARADTLETQLEEERAETARLMDQVDALRDDSDQQLVQFEAGLRAFRDEFARIDRDLQRLREANGELRESNAQMRDALAERIADPELINRGLAAELDALRAMQAADRAELDAVLSELKPLVEEAQ